METRKLSSKGYELNFNLEVTPDAEAFLLFDPKVGDMIKGNGSANLRMEVTEAGVFNIYGLNVQAIWGGVELRVVVPHQVECF